MPAADVAADEVWFDATDQWECDASNPQDSGSWIPPADGTSGSSAAAFEADAAAAFQHAQQSYQQLLEEGASAELIRDQFGVRATLRNCASIWPASHLLYVQQRCMHTIRHGSATH